MEASAQAQVPPRLKERYEQEIAPALQKRHTRPRSIRDAQRAEQVGGVIEKEGPIHVSNVMLVDPKENKPTRVGVERDDDGTRRRVARRSGTRFD